MALRRPAAGERGELRLQQGAADSAVAVHEGVMRSKRMCMKAASRNGSPCCARAFPCISSNRSSRSIRSGCAVETEVADPGELGPRAGIDPRSDKRRRTSPCESLAQGRRRRSPVPALAPASARRGSSRRVRAPRKARGSSPREEGRAWRHARLQSVSVRGVWNCDASICPVSLAKCLRPCPS